MAITRAEFNEIKTIISEESQTARNWLNRAQAALNRIKALFPGTAWWVYVIPGGSLTSFVQEMLANPAKREKALANIEEIRIYLERAMVAANEILRYVRYLRNERAADPKALDQILDLRSSIVDAVTFMSVETQKMVNYMDLNVIARRVSDLADTIAEFGKMLTETIKALADLSGLTGLLRFLEKLAKAAEEAFDWAKLVIPLAIGAGVVVAAKKLR